MQIWAHTLVRNEEKHLWFAVTSVIDHVDKVLLWDTASTDNTVEIIKLLKKKYPNKIDFRQVGRVDPEKFTYFRQSMLDETRGDWFILVDGDEVWWDDSIEKLTEIIRRKGTELESIVHRYFNVVGDIFHYQEEKAGKYEIDGDVGHLTIRALKRNISGLHFGKPHGQQGIYDEEDRLIQNREKSKRVFLDERTYLHFTHMLRSGSKEEDLKVMKRDIKIKYEIGKTFPRDFYYPEVFFKPKPEIVSSPFIKMNRGYNIRALFETPLRKIKRRMIKGRSGY